MLNKLLNCFLKLELADYIMNIPAKTLLAALVILSIHVNVHGETSPTLQQYIADHPKLQVSGRVIACAAGGDAVSMGDKAFPISVYFYPVPGATNFHYFESDSPDIDPKDRAQYRELSLETAPVFNGYLRRFKHGPVANQLWCIVSYEADGKLLLSNPIRLKLASKPTQMENELVEIQAKGIEPAFRWQDGAVRENAIYFEVVSDSAQNLISGTYTRDQHWQFYHLDNVVFNIHDIHPAPILKPDAKYMFTLMGVSEDNWVNLMVQQEFTAGR